MIIHIDRAGGVVTKKAETPAEVARLRQEAVALDRARHPGVVELIGLEHPGELRLRAIDGPCLADYLGDGRRPWTVAARLASAPSSMLRAPGRCPSAYSPAWRTSMTVAGST